MTAIPTRLMTEEQYKAALKAGNRINLGSHARWTLAPLNVSDIVKVYQGEAHMCLCGCSGEYYYNPAFTELVTECSDVLRKVTPDQFNLAKVTAIVTVLNDHIVAEPAEPHIIPDDMTRDEGILGGYDVTLGNVRYFAVLATEYKNQAQSVREFQKKYAEEKAAAEAKAASDAARNKLWAKIQRRQKARRRREQQKAAAAA